jgi:hypothetical protein
MFGLIIGAARALSRVVARALRAIISKTAAFVGLGSDGQPDPLTLTLVGLRLLSLAFTLGSVAAWFIPGDRGRRWSDALWETARTLWLHTGCATAAVSGLPSRA